MDEQNIINRINMYYDQKNWPILKKIEKEVIRIKNPRLSLFLINLPEYEKNYEALENIILNSIEPASNYWIAANTNIEKEKRIRARQNVINSWDPNWNYLIALFSDDGNNNANESAVIEYGSPEVQYNYVKNVSRKRITEHADAVIASKDPYWNYMFITLSNLKKDEHIQVIMDSGNLEYIFYCARNLWKNNNDSFAKKILDSKDPEWNFYYARDVIDADIEKHQQVVIDSGQPKWICKFAKEVKGADKNKLEQKILELAIPAWCYYYAKNIPGADIPKHLKIILESKNPKYNYLSLTTIENVDMQAHGDVIMNSDSDYYKNLYTKYLGDLKDLDWIVDSIQQLDQSPVYQPVYHIKK